MNDERETSRATGEPAAGREGTAEPYRDEPAASDPDRGAPDPAASAVARRRRLPLEGPRRDIGQDPDYRFSLANERTFLAWIRTALALVAGGLAATQVLPDLAVPHGPEIIGGLLVALGTLLSAAAFRRWTHNEEAMREQRTIPTSRLPSLLTVGTALFALVALGLLLWR